MNQEMGSNRLFSAQPRQPQSTLPRHASCTQQYIYFSFLHTIHKVQLTSHFSVNINAADSGGTFYSPLSARIVADVSHAHPSQGLLFEITVR